MPDYKIKQKFWSVGDNFKIVNAADESDFYTVKGKVFSFGDNLTIFNNKEEEIIKIEQRIVSLLPHYKIIKNGEEYATVDKKISLFKDKFVVDVLDIPGKNDYIIKGNVIDHEYKFTKKDKVVAEVSKKFFAWTDSYAVRIDEGEDAEAILALCIVVDQCSHDKDH